MTELDPRDLDDRLAELTPARRALFERRLMEQGMETARRNVISPRADRGPAPLSSAQEHLWLLSQVFDDDSYNAPGAFRLEGPLDLEALRRALDALVERHSILRTTYHLVDGRPMQMVGSSSTTDLHLVDLDGLEADAQQAEAQRVLTQESHFHFDLARGPVLRPTVIRLSADAHILMLNMHHIATDAHSRNLIHRDLTALYDAFAKGLPSSLAPLPVEYADYAVWQRTWLAEGVADRQLGYWKRTLAGAPSRLELPTDFARPPVRSWVGDHTSLMIDLATREQLRAAARRGDATLFVALLATFGVLLARYSGQDDIVIGTPFAGRNRSELDAIVGYFVNPLALRLDLSGDPTFAELIVRARETTTDAIAHADIPYETVVRETNPQRDLSQTPVFQAMMVLHNPAWQTARSMFEPEGLRCHEITYERGWSKFDVLLGVREHAAGLNTTWEYSTELFTAATLRRMTQHFRTLAQSAGSSPERRLSSLSMLPAAERTQVLVSWNPGPEALPERATIKELFEEQVARTPAAPAVVFAGDRLTFDELNRRANQVAWMLRDRGIGPGAFVGILMAKSLDLVAAVLGVVKAGAAYLPLDPNYPANRIDFMVSDAQPKLLLTQEKHLGMALEHLTERVALDAHRVLDDRPEGNPPTSASADDLAYLIYTSGSTGQPKGAMIANRSLVSAYFAYERAYRLHELTAHAQLASFSFDVFTAELIRSLLAGAKLVLCPIETVIDPAALYTLMITEGVDAANFVPATATLLFEYVQREGLTLDHLRLVIVGGEAWRNETYLLFKSLCGPNTRLINSYGLTETTIDSTWFEADPSTELPAGRFVPIGRPYDNTRIYVLDPNLEPQPIGIPGELCVGGIAVARGYLNRPELTAERFVADRFSAEPGARLYRTGDRARWLADGTIDFLGRTDRQIKIRGFRIEPGEIEAALERRPEIRAAAVIDRRDPRGQSRLVAYIDAPGGAPEANVLREFVSNHMPNYMIPAAWVVVEQLPLTPNGKVDRDALPTPDWDRAHAATEFLPPRTATEVAIAGIWSSVLSVQEIGIDANFFALGGHSLLAMQVMSRIRDAFAVALGLRAIFDSPTVRELAVEVDAARTAVPPIREAPLVTVQRVGRPSGGGG